MCSSKGTSTPQSLQEYISDEFLIQKFKKNSKKIAFINYEPRYDRYYRRQHLLNRINALEEGIDLCRQRELVLEIWPYLIENAVVYLKSLDTREEKYHDDAAYGVRKLTDFFKTFREFEPLLYGAEEELYRDHITHMFSVFLLGDYLIRNDIKFKNITVGNPKLKDKLRISEGEKEAMWCIMSLTHDLGYALERIPRISPKARNMLEAFGLVGSIQELSYSFPHRPIHDLLLKFISSDLLEHPEGKGNFISHIQSKYFLKFAEAFERCNHGVISCLVLMKNLVYFLETDYLIDPHKPLEEEDARQFQIRRNILRSIAGHSCDNIYYITIPCFDFLLMIVDEMHEWDRPSLAYLFAEAPITKVAVVKFTKSEVHYRVELQLPEQSPETLLSAREEEKMKADARDYFRKKSEWLFMTLRSAVVGPRERKVKVTFEVADKIGDTSEHHTYKIVHKSPEDVELFDDSRIVDWGYFLKKGEENGSKTAITI